MFSYFFGKSTRQVTDQFQQELETRKLWKSESFSFSLTRCSKIQPTNDICSLCHFYGVCSNCDLRNKSNLINKKI